MSRDPTWYQCVRGSVGAVDSQTVCELPLKETSNQKAKPCSILVFKTWYSTGMSAQISPVIVYYILHCTVLTALFINLVHTILHLLLEKVPQKVIGTV